MSSFLFVRHGHALHNQAFEESNYDESVFESPLFRDAPLTEKGQAQVEECALSLRDRYAHSIRVIFTSPLTRCIQTARAIASVSRHTKIIVTDTLLECLGGNHYCNTRKAYQELVQLHPDLQFQHISAYHVPSEQRPRETEQEVRDRSKSFYPLLLPYMEMYPASTFVVVTHHDWVKANWGVILPNAGVHRVSEAEIQEKINNA